MPKNLDELRRWFPSGTAEGERTILDQVFIYVEEFERIMSPPSGNPYLLIGKKGSGKSAILDFATRFLSFQSTPSIYLKPADIDTSELVDADSIGEISRKLHPVLLSTIAAKLIEGSEERFLTGDLATVYDEAVRSGHISPSLIGRFGRAFIALAKPITKVDPSNVFPALTGSTRSELQKAISRLLSDDRIYLFVDDSDQIANPERPGHLNRLWGLILTIRSLSERIPQLRAIVTLRTEVWNRLTSEKLGNRDQTDHFTNLTVELANNTDRIKQIIDRRFECAKIACGSKESLYESFFERDRARAPHSEEYRNWPDLIIVRSRQRPRDAIQLINRLADHAGRAKVDKIREDDFRAVMPSFSAGRAVLFAQEAENDCPVALDILNTFALINYNEGGFRLTAEEAKAHLLTLPSRFSIQLHGTTISPNREDQMYDLWRFLYTSGVLNARTSDMRASAGYRHLDPATDQLRISAGSWNEMQKHLWEINPAYRDHLAAKQIEDRNYIGLPLRRQFSKRFKLKR